jgi:hypothetical protein
VAENSTPTTRRHCRHELARMGDRVTKLALCTTTQAQKLMRWSNITTDSQHGLERASRLSTLLSCFLHGWTDRSSTKDGNDDDKLAATQQSPLEHDGVTSLLSLLSEPSSKSFARIGATFPFLFLPLDDVLRRVARVYRWYWGSERANGLG